MQALRTGYTSIMIDGSHETFEENIAADTAGSSRNFGDARRCGKGMHPQRHL